ncbi:hypothetical protein EDC19_2272 [Natranaerovirga hydrolytica]|uniref:Uncharacterized protein n=1 Tax=Natranaerovirga hydrolytica TaxID=680378 RepID=A0A4R1ML17_9FIRM|nr:hypothetical protein [Natranaerovirga hydrolytica]TCK90503.1 hypothetical protein EDC19_2272 [Natranaerovirga hydrolytica]
MKHNNKRVCKIIHELTYFLLMLGATNLNVNVEHRKDEYKITIKSNFNKKEQRYIDKLIKGVTAPRQEEIEEYYWELAGETDLESELNLIGIMINEANVEVNDDLIEIELYRKK